MTDIHNITEIFQVINGWYLFLYWLTGTAVLCYDFDRSFGRITISDIIVSSLVFWTIWHN